MDTAKLRAPQDSTRINLNEKYELVYWSKSLGVSEARLIAAVKKVGLMADAVKMELAAFIV